MFVIWDEYINLEDWDFRDYCNDEEEYEEMTEEDKWKLAADINYDYFEDERCNLSSIKNNHNIVAFADLGLWDGRRRGYKLLNTTDIGECLQHFVRGYSTMCFYVENGEFMARETHHDGTNYYTFRFVKDDIDEYEIDNYIYDGIVIDEFTMPMGQVILDYYGATEV